MSNVGFQVVLGGGGGGGLTGPGNTWQPVAKDKGGHLHISILHTPHTYPAMSHVSYGALSQTHNAIMHSVFAITNPDVLDYLLDHNLYF